MKLLIPMLGIIAITNAVSLIDLIEEEWKTFKLQYDKRYKSEAEEYLRIKIFMENKIKIAKHNQLFEKGLVTYELGLNKYADMSHHEFLETMHGYRKIPELNNTSGVEKEEWTYFISPANVQLPSNIDWRQKGVVTPVKDQGRCGSCWVFSATGSLEGQYARRHGVLVSLSEQNLLDCSTRFGNNGCQGGWMGNAFLYIKVNGGIDTEKSYPYEGINNICRFKPQNVAARVKGFVELPQGDENKLKEAVATIGPISVAIDASHESFQFYKDGVYFDSNCRSKKLDHGVLVVGYGVQTAGQDYWLVKNSWGSTWGNQGYIKMARNKNNNCGIATDAIYPLV